ncbi:MAG: hypothetical protein JHC74_04660 [Thermoleophilia bacterium]|nr:hypothetical protein [Thermoleophilia bacterium]
MPATLQIRGGGVPDPAQLAALAAAATTFIEGERAAPADPVPAAYRSRWRRAALIESSEVPLNLKDDGTAWRAH